MKSTRVVGAALCVVLAALVSPRTAAAQLESGQWRATPVFGYTTFDEKTPFESTPMIGGTVQYSFNSVVSAGVGMGYTRPDVDGSYFPLVLFKVDADTSILFQGGYQSSQWNYYGFLTAGVPLSKLYLYAQGGVGGITTWFDRQAFRDQQIRTGETSVTNLMIPLGVGISYAVSSLVGVRIDVVDEIWTGFDRNRLQPTLNSNSPFNEGRFLNTCEVENFCILDANGTPPEVSDSETVHNFRFSIGFEFTPGR